MAYHIALAGKGSTGKSTLAPFILEHCLRALPADRRVLLVQADPQGGALESYLHLTPRTTLGRLRSEYERQLARGAGLPPTESRVEFAEKRMWAEALTPIPAYGDRAAFLALGHWESPGSNCVANRVLAAGLEELSTKFQVVILDHEAGLEAVGRYTHPIDSLWLVAKPTPLFVRVAAQILARCHEVGRTVRAAHLILNMTRTPEDAQTALTWPEAAALPPFGLGLPESAALADLSAQGASPLTLAPTEVWRATLENALPRLLPLARLEK